MLHAHVCYFWKWFSNQFYYLDCLIHSDRDILNFKYYDINGEVLIFNGEFDIWCFVHLIFFIGYISNDDDVLWTLSIMNYIDVDDNHWIWQSIAFDFKWIAYLTSYWVKCLLNILNIISVVVWNSRWLTCILILLCEFDIDVNVDFATSF